jgi:putative phage-type endonuclease
MSTAFKPGSPEWARLVTASKVAGILSISPWDSQYKVWCVMAGLIPPDPENEAMRRGNMLEDAILNWWLADNPDAIELGRQVTCQIPDEPWAAATPDMIVYSAADVDSPIEIVDAKTSSDDEDWGRPGTDEAPKYYIASSMWQLAMHPAADAGPSRSPVRAAVHPARVRDRAGRRPVRGTHRPVPGLPRDGRFRGHAATG